MKIEIKHKITGAVLFSNEQENNSMLKTLELAVSVKADLSYADLRDADLIGADLSYADLIGADLRGTNLIDADLIGANLSYANLRYADLIGANLSYANLSYANLSGSNLSGANLRDAVGNNSRMSCMQLGKYNLVVLDNEICWGGCTKKTVKEWMKHKGEELSESDRHYLKTVTKPFLRMVLKMG